MIIKLVRHGQSKSNIGDQDATWDGDHNIELTPTGRRQARLAGEKIGFGFVGNAIIYRSPYARTRQTCNELLQAADAPLVESGAIPFPFRILEDPRLREVEWGYQKDEDHGDHVDKMRETHGKFYYRIDGGESPADCFDRVSGFIDTMMRQVGRKNAEKVLIVSHGLTIRTFVMRFMHLTVEEFDDIWNPKNADIITITDKISGLIAPQFRCGKWGAYGLRLPKRGDPGYRALPWECPECGNEEVWPHPEFDDGQPERRQLSDPIPTCYMCEICRYKLFVKKIT